MNSALAEGRQQKNGTAGAWISVLAIVLVVPWSVPAAAQDMPRYDPITYCDGVSAAVGGSDMIKNGCIEQEQSAYDGLKSSWYGIDSQHRSYCDNVASMLGGTYQILKGCIEQEAGAAARQPGFSY